MHNTHGIEPQRPLAASSAWQGLLERLARLGWLLLLSALAVGLFGGLLTAWTGDAADTNVPTSADECLQPPCFDLNLSGISRYDAPSVLWLVCSMLALVVSLPNLATSVAMVVRQQWHIAGRHLLTFVGPLIIFVGAEIIPHVLLPCGLAPVICEDVPGQGLNVRQQWHLLDHMLVGAVPLMLLYGWALRRWRPAIISGSKPKPSRVA